MIEPTVKDFELINAIEKTSERAATNKSKTNRKDSHQKDSEK